MEEIEIWYGWDVIDILYLYTEGFTAKLLNTIFENWADAGYFVIDIVDRVRA